MKAEELKTKSQDELNKLLDDLSKQLLNLRFQRSQGQLENTAKLRTNRRDIARIKTALGQLQNGSAPAAKSAKAAKAPKAKKAAKKAA